jgi:predicted aminopeptidase
MATGCYLGHVASGQMRLLWARTPVAEVDADPTTPEALRQRLDLVAEVRVFARALGLDVDGQYTSYAPWPGDSLVTTVVATRPGAVEPVTSWFPIVGKVPYRGYFDTDRAHAHADTLRAEGLDVCVVPVRAYSTLGWFDDPLTGPMLRQPRPVLVETLLHELVHATVFVPGDAEFNEGVAAFFAQEARVRF